MHVTPLLDKRSIRNRNLQMKLYSFKQLSISSDTGRLNYTRKLQNLSLVVRLNFVKAHILCFSAAGNLLQYSQYFIVNDANK
jgi:hypothetical protein